MKKRRTMLDNLYPLHLLLFHLVAEHIRAGVVVAVRYFVSPFQEDHMTCKLLFCMRRKKRGALVSTISSSCLRGTYDQTVDTIATLSAHQDERRGALGLTWGAGG